MKKRWTLFIVIGLLTSHFAFAYTTKYCAKFQLSRYNGGVLQEIQDPFDCRVTQTLKVDDLTTEWECRFRRYDDHQFLVSEADDSGIKAGALAFSDHYLSEKTKLGQFLFQGLEIPGEIINEVIFRVYYFVQKPATPIKSLLLKTKEQDYLLTTESLMYFDGCLPQ